MYKPHAPSMLSHPRPRIADVQCRRLVFSPGDKVIVRIYQKMDKQTARKLKKSVEKWAGDVEVLVVDCTVFDVEVDKSGGILHG